MDSYTFSSKKWYNKVRKNILGGFYESFTISRFTK